jgi:tyrosine-protein phosphatase
VIALVMRASRDVSQSYKLGLEEVREGGMHAAYAYVKEKSKCIGPNMS